MSRIAVVAPRPVPYVHGGAERHWDALVAALIGAGHQAELLAVDTPESTSAEVLASYRRFLALDVSGFDAVISGKYPSWMVQHPLHVRHLNHPLRGLYDLYPRHLPPASVEQRAQTASFAAAGPTALLDWAEAQDLNAPEWSLPGPWMQAVIQALDETASRKIRVQAAVSEAVALRPSYAPLLGSGPVAIISPLTDLPTPVDPGASDAGIGAHFFAFGRLTADKRFDLAIEAFDRSGLGRAQPEPFELWIAGTGPEAPALQALADRTTGVRLLGRCSDDELTRYLASAVAVVLTPRDEDYGLVAAEAHAAGRPILTTTDSGGIAEQVLASAPPAGIVVPPMPRRIGAAMRDLALDPAGSDRRGRAGRDRVLTLTWRPLLDLVEHHLLQHHLLEHHLLEHHLLEPERLPPRPRVLVLSTFLAEPVTGGGSRRLRAVANRLQSFADVTVLAITNEITGVRNRRLDDGVVQLAVGRSRPHLKADHEMRTLVGVPVDDIAIGPLHRTTPAFAPLLAARVEAADLIVLAHPFLAPALPTGMKKPTVYDAHNVEIDLKERLLSGRPGATRLMEWCEKAEAQALARATVVSAVSDADLARLCPPGCGHRNLVAPNGVDDQLLECPPGPGPQRAAARARLLADIGMPDDGRPVVLFVGSSHAPNHEAADRLADLAIAAPELLIVLAGSHSNRSRTGPVSLGSFADHDLIRLLLAADVIVNPVESGSGTNLKLIEALASGTPVVATEVGARGLPDPGSVLHLTEPRELLAGIRAVLAAPGPARERAAAGQELAMRYRWDVALGPLESAIADLLGVPLTT